MLIVPYSRKLIYQPHRAMETPSVSISTHPIFFSSKFGLTADKSNSLELTLRQPRNWESYSEPMNLQRLSTRFLNVNLP